VVVTRRATLNYAAGRPSPYYVSRASVRLYVCLSVLTDFELDSKKAQKNEKLM